MAGDELNPAPPTLEETLAWRSAAIAQDDGQAGEEMLKLVIFELGGERFACRGEHIREIIFAAEVYFVPGCPDTLEGVINVRGDITSVIRLDRLLELANGSIRPGQRSSILLGRGNGMESGIRVGQVIDVIDLPARDIQPSPATLSETLRLRMPGVLHFQQRAATLLDLDRLFADYARGLG